MIISYNEFKKRLHDAFAPSYKVHYSQLKNVHNFVEKANVPKYNDILIIETDTPGLDYYLNMEMAYGTCINKHHGDILSYIRDVEDVLEDQYSLGKQLHMEINDIQAVEDDYQEELCM